MRMENPFADLERDIFRLSKSDGTKIENLRSTGINKGEVLFFRQDVDFEEGDLLERQLPHGKIETYLVEDVRYTPGLEVIPPSYTLTLSNVAKPKKEPVPRTVTYNLYGTNSRVNNHSTDQSRNVVGIEPADLFRKIEEALNNVTAGNEDLQALQREVAEMKATQGQPTFVTHYIRFMSLAADHLTVFIPFLPALAQMLTGTGQNP